MKILFLLLFFILLQSNNGENCVDCDNDNEEYMGIHYEPTILYECVKRVKIYVQKYTCDGCGYFEVSVRDNMNKTTRGSCTP